MKFRKIYKPFNSKYIVAYLTEKKIFTFLYTELGSLAEAETKNIELSLDFI